MLTHEQVRRHVSVDFTVPEEYRESLRLSGDEWVVPLALLAKRPLVHFDLRNEEGHCDPAADGRPESDDRPRAALPGARRRPREQDAERDDAGRGRPADRGGAGRRRAASFRADRRGSSASAAWSRCQRFPRGGRHALARLHPVGDRARRSTAGACSSSPTTRGSRSGRRAQPLLRHAGVHGGGELSRRGGGAAGPARPLGPSCSTMRRARVLAGGLRDADRPVDVLRRHPSPICRPGLQRPVTARSAAVPRAGGAGGLVIAARSPCRGCSPNLARPGREAGRRSHPAVDLGGVLRARAAQRGAPAAAARCSRATGCCSWPRRSPRCSPPPARSASGRPWILRCIWGSAALCPRCRGGYPDQ